MLILGIQMLRKKVVPLGIALLLCIAGIAFPVSRISRIEIIAHIADLALLVPCLYISFKGLHKQAAG
jgi:hypothetical protein